MSSREGIVNMFYISENVAEFFKVKLDTSLAPCIVIQFFRV